MLGGDHKELKMKVDGSCHCGRIKYEAEKLTLQRFWFVTAPTANRYPALHFARLFAFRRTLSDFSRESQKSTSNKLKAGQSSPKPFVLNAGVPFMGRMSVKIQSSTAFAWVRCDSVTLSRRKCKSGVARRSPGSVIWRPLERSSSRL